MFVDAETPLSALTHQTVRQIESLAPFGHGNERPMLCTTGVRLTEPPRRMGATGRHLSLRLEQHGVALRAVAFGGGDWEEDLNGATGPLAVAFKPVINNFRGRQTVEMQLADWRCDGNSYACCLLPAAVPTGLPPAYHGEAICGRSLRGMFRM